MNNTINRMMIGTSLIGITFSLGLGNAYAQTCEAIPSCAELGYTEVSCPDGSVSLKCPFDQTKLFCATVSSSSSTASCEELGYNDTWCDLGGGAGALKCPFDQTKMHCSVATKSCETGDIFYDDFTCSFDRNPNKTPIAVVTNGTPSIQLIALNDKGGSHVSACNYTQYGLEWAYAYDDSSTSGPDIYYTNTVANLTSDKIPRIQAALVRAGGTKLSGTYEIVEYSPTSYASQYAGKCIYDVSYTDTAITVTNQVVAHTCSAKVRCVVRTVVK